MSVPTKNLRFGTVDTWILWHLTGRHITDLSNASRTLLVNINSGDYDEDLLSLFSIPFHVLPTLVPSQGFLGEITLFSYPIPVFSVIGDQQSALFSQCGENSNIFKNTYGTGLFLMAFCGYQKPVTKNLLTTIAWQKEGKISYALEGSMFLGGAAIQWLKEDLGLISTVQESDALAQSVVSTDGVVFIPALTGLGAPYWNPYVKGAWLGMKRSTSKAHLVRSVLESMAYQTKSVIDEMSDYPVHLLKADGGLTRNLFLMQFQSDILNIPLHKASQLEATAFGAAALAGLYCQFWTEEDLDIFRANGEVLNPKMTRHYYEIWQSKMRDLDVFI
jgi:glycerol kinase